MLIIETKSQCLSSKTTIELINELSTCHEKVSNSTRIRIVRFKLDRIGFSKISRDLKHWISEISLFSFHSVSKHFKFMIEFNKIRLDIWFGFSKSRSCVVRYFGEARFDPIEPEQFWPRPDLKILCFNNLNINPLGILIH